METITIINKSGKVMSTSKHLINIFKDAKLAYQEKKAEFHEERRLRESEKMAQRLLTERVRMSDARSQISGTSHRSHRSHTRARGTEGSSVGTKRPPLTIENLSQLDGGSETTRGPSRRGSRRGSEGGGGGGYKKTTVEDALPSRPSLSGFGRRHTDQPLSPDRPSISSTLSSPIGISSRPIDMNLAYGEMHKSHIPPPVAPEEKELELTQKMSRLDSLLLEAECLGHSATTIIQNLQANPEAMAAVALTLAEIANLIKIMSPGILTAIKGASPAIFALLICPEFLIGTGVAVGVTVVMFGGYKIVKRIQQNMGVQKDTAAPAADKAKGGKVDKDGRPMDEALVFEDDGELSSVAQWVRGVEDEVGGMAEGSVLAGTETSVEGEFITPEAASIRKMRYSDRIMKRAAREGRECGSHRRSKSVIVVGSDRSAEASASASGKSGKSRRSKPTTVGAEKGERKAVGLVAEGEKKSKKERKEKDVKSHEKEMVKDMESKERDVKGNRKEVVKGKEKKPSMFQVMFKGKSDKVKMLGV